MLCVYTCCTFRNIFCLIIHLSHSKKGLPLPPVLPVPLKSFLVNAPVIPPVAGAAPAAPGQGPPPAHPVHAHAPLNTARGASPAQVESHVSPVKASISNAFDFESPAQSIPLPSMPGGVVASPVPAAGGPGSRRQSFTGDNASDVSHYFCCLCRTPTALVKLDWFICYISSHIRLVVYFFTLF